MFVRQVCAANLVQELSTIRALLERYSYITVHAENPGGDEEGASLPPGVRIDDLPAASRYGLAKLDVDASVPYSQLGITLCDADGKLPALPTAPWPGAAAAPSVWQVELHHRDTGSVSGSGTSSSGSVSLRAFAHALFATGVVSAERRGTVTWVAYGGLYHFGFLLKVLTGGARLPDTKEEFLASLAAYLGDRLFDGRYVAAWLPGGEVSLKGPLTHVAALLGAPAATTAAEMEPWQAGERSRVACQVFMRLKGLFFAWDSIDVHAGCIHGLHSPTSS